MADGASTAGAIATGIILLAFIGLTVALAIKKGMHFDVAAEHPLLSCSARFADHTSFTKEERQACLIVDILSSFWLSYMTTHMLTSLGVANGFPTPICGLLSTPGFSVDWVELPS